MKLVAIVSLLAVGCVTETDHEAPIDQQPVNATGSYDVRSTLDLTVDALLPAAIHDKVVVLHDFSQHPAKTLFETAEAAGVPAVEDIRDALPSHVEDKLYGWIDGEIAKLSTNGTSVTQHADLAALAEQSLGKFAIDSTLVVTGTTAAHTLATLDLSPAGIAATFPLPNMTAHPTCASTDGTFMIGAHGYSIPYGKYVWQAINAELDIRAALGAAVPCAAIAHTVAAKCVLGVCVGHEAQLTEICERGLDEAVDRVHDEFTATKLDLLQLDGGVATLTDANTMTGTWSAKIDVGQGLRHAPATFTATR
jgi:hypothetical protein